MDKRDRTRLFLKHCCAQHLESRIIMIPIKESGLICKDENCNRVRFWSNPSLNGDHSMMDYFTQLLSCCTVTSRYAPQKAPDMVAWHCHSVTGLQVLTKIEKQNMARGSHTVAFLVARYSVWGSPRSFSPFLILYCSSVSLLLQCTS